MDFGPTDLPAEDPNLEVILNESGLGLSGKKFLKLKGVPSPRSVRSEMLSLSETVCLATERESVIMFTSFPDFSIVLARLRGSLFEYGQQPRGFACFREVNIQCVFLPS